MAAVNASRLEAPSPLRQFETANPGNIFPSNQHLSCGSNNFTAAPQFRASLTGTK
jgi:hypothetical protein